MNIFKILANGDGRINEANISAFLGYLLDPYQDHGLGFEFLERFINKLKINDFNVRKYDYEIVLESKFTHTNKDKNLVDIVIISFSPNVGNSKESKALNLIHKTRTLNRLFLIENKIKPNVTEGQLQAQYGDAKKNIKSPITSIYITPYSQEVNQKAKEDIKKEISHLTNESKFHYKWHINEDEESEENELVISDILRSIISDESNGKIEGVNSYTKITLISFLKFIENDFKSELIEKKEDKEGKYIPKTFLNWDEFKSAYNDLLNEDSFKISESFTKYVIKNYPAFEILHSKTHPVSVYFKHGRGNKIISITSYGKNTLLHLVTKNFPEVDVLELESEINKTYSCKRENLSLEIKNIKTAEGIISLFEKLITLIGQKKSMLNPNLTQQEVFPATLSNPPKSSPLLSF